MPLLLLTSGLCLVALHVMLWRTREADVERTFKMARGIAALTLSVVGFAGLIGALPRWDVGFLDGHAPDDRMIVGVSIAYGHLLADYVSMAYPTRPQTRKPTPPSSTPRSREETRAACTASATAYCSSAPTAATTPTR